MRHAARRRTHRRAFTLLEVLIVNALLLLVVSAVQPATQRARENGMKLRDGTQLRAITQGTVLFAQANRDRFPLATRIDRFNDTEGDPPAALSQGGDVDPDKNRTGAILSVMIFADIITPEMCVSPADNGNVRIHDAYQYRRPDGANTPGRAVYDPAFSGTPFDSASDAVMTNNVTDRAGVSHNSYAHNCVAFARAADWTNTSSASKPVWGNRGPVYTDKRAHDPADPGWELLPDNPLGSRSNTILVWGDEGRWRGNIAFADARVDFSESPQPAGATFTFGDGAGNRVKVTDNIFVDERFENPDAAARRNAYLRQWKRGIPIDLAPEDFDTRTHLAPTNDAEGFAWTD
ncbi:MAG: hypothetical protein AAGH64_02975 [Planctomycetota bacterium]